MPRGIRTIVAEVVMYVGMFVIVGHLCQNLCERYMMQKDFKIMKSNLILLQKTINSMEMAYDSLLGDAQDRLGKEKKAASSFIQLYPKCLRTCLKKVSDVGTKTDIVTKDFMQNFKRSAADFWSSSAKDESTLTERLLNCLNYTDKEAREAIETSEEVEFCNCIYQCLSQYTGWEKYGPLKWRNQNSPSNESIKENFTKTKEPLINNTKWKVIVFPTW